MPREELSKLRRIARAFFTQDYRLDFASAAEAGREISNSSSAEWIAALVSEIDAFLLEFTTEEGARSAWMELGGKHFGSASFIGELNELRTALSSSRMVN